MKKTALVVAVSAALTALMVYVPAALNAAFDLFDLGLGWAGPLVVVTVISAIVGVLFIMAFPHVSAQEGIKAVKDRIKYNLLGIRLFQDNLPVVLRSTGGTLGWNFGYIGLNLLPMVVLAAPFMAIWFQLDSLYAFQPLKVGQERTVVCELRQDVDPTTVQVQMPADGSWSLVEGPVRIAGGPGERWINFVVRAEKPGRAELVLRQGSTTVSKVLAAGPKMGRLASRRTAHPWRDFFHAKDPILYFGEGILPPDSFVQSIDIEYPTQPLGPFGGGEITIMLIFAVVSMAFGFGLKGFFGVEI